MAAITPFFRAFGPLLFGRPARHALQKIARLDSLAELYELFGHLLPERLLAPTQAGVGSRQRLFSTQVTFWAFVAQILSPGTACREIVRRVEAGWREQGDDQPGPNASTSASCQARARLDPATLELIRAELCWSLERNVLTDERGLAGRPVKIVDGTCLSLPDTAENQTPWPQPSGQQPGCGFPVLKLGRGVARSTAGVGRSRGTSRRLRPPWAWTSCAAKRRNCSNARCSCTRSPTTWCAASCNALPTAITWL